jgi:hypothetical protein
MHAFFNHDFGLITETRTRQNYTRVTYQHDVSVYDCKNYVDYYFSGRLASARAEEFASLKGGVVVREKTVRFEK